MNLEEIVTLISNVLNDVANNPVNDFYYDVKSTGFHADTAMIQKQGRNIIRVFVAQMGGSYNPVQGLGESTWAIPITFYFPVRFKEQFFNLDEYLHNYFVGRNLDGKIANLSVASYGEIQNLDFKEFKNWADNLYKTPIEVMEQYLSMTLTLYLSSINSDYFYGNEVTASIAFQDGGTTYTLPLMFTDGSIQTNSSSIDDQVLGTLVAEGLPYGEAFACSFAFYASNSTACKKFVSMWLSHSFEETPITLTITIPSLGTPAHDNTPAVPYTKTEVVYLRSCMLPITKGQPTKITISMAKRRQ